MKVEINLFSGPARNSICYADFDRNIEALERYKNGTERVCDLTPMIDTIWILKALQERVRRQGGG